MAEPSVGGCSAARSRLGDSLVRLHRSLQAARCAHDRADDLFETFRRRWWKARRRLASRLEMIDSQLERLSPPRSSGPRLSLIAAAEGEEATSLLSE